MSKKISVLLIICIMCGVLQACSNQPEIIPQNGVSYRAGSGDIYNNIFFICDRKTGSPNYSIFYYSLPEGDAPLLSNLSLSSLHLCADVLCSHTDESCPAYLKTPVYSIVVDKKESDQNNASPILYMFDHNQIKKYDVAANSNKIIKEYEDGYPLSMWVYEDWIYTSFLEGKEIQLRRIDKQGNNEIIYSRKDKEISCRIIGFDQSYMYYVDFLSNYYRIDLSLTNEEFLFSTNCFVNGYISNGFLYYCDDLTSTTFSNTNFETCNLYRYNLRSTTSEKEFLDDNILISVTPMVFFADDKILYNKCSPDKIGENVLTDESGTNFIADVWRSGSSKMYAYDTKKENHYILFEDSGYELSRFYYADDRVILFRAIEYYQDPSGTWYQTSNLVLYDYVANTITTLT